MRGPSPVIRMGGVVLDGGQESFVEEELSPIVTVVALFRFCLDTYGENFFGKSLHLQRLVADL